MSALNSSGSFSCDSTAASGTGNSITALGNTTGLSSSGVVTLGSQSISAAGGLSAGMSNGTLVLSGATGGGGGAATQSVLIVQSLTNAANLPIFSSTEILEPFQPYAPVAVNQIKMWYSLNPSPISASSRAAAGYSAAATVAFSGSVVLYSQSSSNGDFASFASATETFAIAESLIGSGTSWSDTITISYQTGSGVSSSVSSAVLFSTSSWSSALGQYGAFGQLFTRTKEHDLALATTLSPGYYIAGYLFSSSGSQSGVSSITTSNVPNLLVGIANNSGVASASMLGDTTPGMLFDVGVFPTSSSGGLISAGFNRSDIQFNGKAVVMLMGQFT